MNVLVKFILLLGFLLLTTASSMAGVPFVYNIPDAAPLEVNVPAFLSQAQSGTVLFSSGETHLTLLLEEFTLSPQGARTYIKSKTGTVEVDLPAPISFRGKVKGYTDSQVCLTISSDVNWVRGFIIYGDEWINLQPAQEIAPATGAWPHLIYRIKSYDRDAELEILKKAGLPTSPQDIEASVCNTLIVGDTEYYNLNTTTWYQRMVAHINYVSERMNVAIGTTFSVYRYMIDHTLGPTSSSNTLLENFRAKNLNMTPPRRQLAHLLTGRYFDDGTFGRSANALGRAYGNSVAQMVPTITYTASDYQQMLISLHEIGHNFSAAHDLAGTWFEITSICAWTAYSVMYPAFMGNCTAWTFTAANIKKMKEFVGYALSDSKPQVNLFTIDDSSLYTRTREVSIFARFEDYTYVWALSNALDPDMAVNYNGAHSIEEPWTLTEGDGLKEVYLTVAGMNDIAVVLIDSIILDENPPSPVANLASASHTIGLASDQTQVTVNWEAPVETGSGLAGYSVLWTQDAESVPDDTLDISAGALADSSLQLADGEWYFAIKAVDNIGWIGETARTGPFVIDTQTGLADGGENIIPRDFYVKDNYPNPFNPITNIDFGLPQQSTVHIKIYNVYGQVVRTLLNAALPAGRHSVKWNGRDDRGNRAASGVFFYRVDAGDRSVTKKMILMK